MKDYNIIQQQLLLKLNLLFEKHLIKPSKLFNNSLGEKGKTCFQEFLQVIESCSDSPDTLYELYSANLSWIKEAEQKGKLETNHSESLKKLISVAYSFNEFYDVLAKHFYKFEE